MFCAAGSKFSALRFGTCFPGGSALASARFGVITDETPDFFSTIAAGKWAFAVVRGRHKGAAVPEESTYERTRACCDVCMRR